MSKKYLNTDNKNLYKKIVNFFIKDGNRVKASKLVGLAFSKVSKKTGLSFNQILSKLFVKLNSFVEIKKIRVRRGFHMVPFPISHKRSMYLITKWLVLAIKRILESYLCLRNSPPKSIIQWSPSLLSP